jgi:hypothetical protein
MAHFMKFMNSSAQAPASCSSFEAAFWQVSALRKAKPQGLATKWETQWHSKFTEPSGFVGPVNIYFIEAKSDFCKVKKLHRGIKYVRRIMG